MKPYIASLINAIVLISFGLWGYLASDSPSPTALIPVIFGIGLVSLIPSFRKGNRTIAHVSVVITFLVLLGLVKPLLGVIDRGESLGIFRVVSMMGTSILALIIFVKSFIDARRK